MTNVDIEKCRLTFYPSKVITSVSVPVEKVDDNIRMLAEKMVDIMLESKGIGFAAPQAGVGLQMFVTSLAAATREDMKVYINPSLITEGRTVAEEEGCLSLPGIYTKITRYEKCIVTATDLDSNEFTEQAEGLYARCLQHEYDHLQGVTIADRMRPVARIAHRRQLKKLQQQQENY